MMMKMNFTQVSYFTLAAYFDSGPLKYFYFSLVLSVYLFIVCSNVLLIVVICGTRSLHEPMFMFLCSLFVNQLYGSSALFPFLLLHILSDVHTVPAPLCFLQIFCVHLYGAVEYFNLAVMSYDRYLAICCPLQYNRQMSSSKIALLIAVTWVFPCLAMFVSLSLTSSLQLCGNVINKVYCDTHSLIKLACSGTHVTNVYGLVATFITVSGALMVILYTYMKILQVCFSASKQTRQKAASTCAPHLASLLNFSFGACFEILQSRFDMNTFPGTLRIFLSLYFLMCQPLFNPVLYGLQMSTIRMKCKRLLSNEHINVVRKF